MPRTARVVLPGYPHHIIQRGHNRQTTFRGHPDFSKYLDTMASYKDAFGVRIFAFCLMDNHVHLLLAPENLSGLAALMKRLAGRQTRYFNVLESRTGTLWESRYKSSPVEADSYLLTCMRYIELNPVRARLVADPACYPWSSCSHHLGMARVDWLDEDPCYAALGRDNVGRQAAYSRLLHSAVTDEELALIREAAQRGQLTGTPRFIDQVEALAGRRMVSRARGRPRLETTNGTGQSRP
jgi:putative transposase